MIWMNLENMLSERRQPQKATDCMILIIRKVQNREIYRDSRLVVIRGGGLGWSGDLKSMAKGWRVSFQGTDHVLKLAVAKDAQICEHTNAT